MLVKFYWAALSNHKISFIPLQNRKYLIYSPTGLQDHIVEVYKHNFFQFYSYKGNAWFCLWFLNKKIDTSSEWWIAGKRSQELKQMHLPHTHLLRTLLAKYILYLRLGLSQLLRCFCKLLSHLRSRIRSMGWRFLRQPRPGTKQNQSFAEERQKVIA